MTEQTVPVKRDIRAEQRAAAERFRQQMSAQGTLVVRLLSSPGAGKTTLLQKTAEHLGRQYRVGVLVGDVETNRDAERLAPFQTTRHGRILVRRSGRQSQGSDTDLYPHRSAGRDPRKNLIRLDDRRQARQRRVSRLRCFYR